MPLLSRTALRRCFLFSLKTVVRLRDDFFTVNLTSSSELGKISFTVVFYGAIENELIRIMAVLRIKDFILEFLIIGTLNLDYLLPNKDTTIPRWYP